MAVIAQAPVHAARRARTGKAAGTRGLQDVCRSCATAGTGALLNNKRQTAVWRRQDVPWRWLLPSPCLQACRPPEST